MKKCFCALFLMLICVFCNFGFAPSDAAILQVEPNAFRLVRQVDGSNKIGLTYVFPLNTKKMRDGGFTEDEIKVYRFYLSTYVNALAQSNKTNATDGTTVGNCVYFSDVDGLGFSIVFDDLTAQNKFFGVEESEDKTETSNKKTSGFFIRTTKIETNFPISQKAAGDLKMICIMAISSWSKDNSISAEKKNILLNALNSSVFIYDFATTQDALKSDIMYDDDTFHHNVFAKSLDNLDEKITFYVSTPNRPLWYLSALAFVLICMLFAFIIYKKKRRK